MKPVNEHLRRGIYILPSFFTTLNLAAGFISIIFSIDRNFDLAAWFIIISIIMDMVDGRIARLTNTTSRFGVEYDSLADLVSFGIAPAILMYQMVLHSMNKPGIAIALFFVLAGAIRLARYNVKTTEADAPMDFVGLPIPAAAGILASFALSYDLFIDPNLKIKTIPLVMDKMPFFFQILPLLMVIISFLMVSNVPYAAFKKFKADRPKSLQILLVVIIGITLMISYPQNTVFILFIVYLLSGLAVYAWRYWRLRRASLKSLRKEKIGNKEEN